MWLHHMCCSTGPLPPNPPSINNYTVLIAGMVLCCMSATLYLVLACMRPKLVLLPPLAHSVLQVKQQT